MCEGLFSMSGNFLPVLTALILLAMFFGALWLWDRIRPHSSLGYANAMLSLEFRAVSASESEPNT